MKFMLYSSYGALAQLGARHTGSVEVTGSNPVCSIFSKSRKSRICSVKSRVCGFFVTRNNLII